MNCITCLLLCPDDILDILIFLALDTVIKYVKEQKFIIRPNYLGWLVKDVSRVIIIKKIHRLG